MVLLLHFFELGNCEHADDVSTPHGTSSTIDKEINRDKLKKFPHHMVLLLRLHQFGYTNTRKMFPHHMVLLLHYKLKGYNSPAISFPHHMVLLLLIIWEFGMR